MDLGPWKQLERFLILGCEGGTYYASEQKLVAENLRSVQVCITADGPRVVEQVRTVSVTGRAPKNSPALLVLALCLKSGNLATKAAVRKVVPEVCRTGTHLFMFVAYVKALGGFGPAVQKAVGAWYTKNTPSKLVYQSIKYREREGWSHRDLLRLCHLRPETPVYGAIYRYMVKGWEGEVPDAAPDVQMAPIWAAERARTVSVAEVCTLIREYSLPREVVPSEMLKSSEIWRALLDADMPMTALLRNLGKLTEVGLLKGKNPAVMTVVRRLSDKGALRKARIHPLTVLVALRTYAGGSGIRGSLKWTPVPEVLQALDSAFYDCFEWLPCTGKRFMLGLDISGSMECGTIAGMPGVSPRVGSAAMAMVTMRAEKEVQVYGFSSNLLRLKIDPAAKIESVCKAISGLSFGMTNPGLLIEYALEKEIPVDAFVVYTDNEVNQGTQPAALLKQYRKKMGIAARLVVVGMTATPFSIGDPDDAGTLAVVGFDTAAPELISCFAAGEL
jgi:60 kDa SS-A/Ro ribonucleoprotein